MTVVELKAELDERSTLHSDRIRNVLTDEIARGDLLSGAALDEQELADRFGVSRTPVRDALRQLAVTGLVDIRPRRGAIVTRMTPARIMDMFEAMAEIEALCARLAAHRMTPIERSKIMQLHQASKTMVEARDVDAYDGFNGNFHELLYQATHNSVLAEQAIALRMRLSAFRRTQLRQGDRMIRSREEHDNVMVAIAEGDGDTAARRMRAHMLNAATALEQYIAEHV